MLGIASAKMVAITLIMVMNAHCARTDIVTSVMAVELAAAINVKVAMD